MAAGRRLGLAALLGLTAVCGTACTPAQRTLATVLPHGSLAAPWILDGAVWEGSFDQAAPALGDDADALRPFDPTRVWLAVYRHESRPGQTLTVRVWAFGSQTVAQQALARLRPVPAERFKAGDQGYWTDLGVLFSWGRLVFDIISSEPSQQVEYDAARLTGCIERRMPPGLPDDPR
jgi:hypothetical protein